jgi:S1-C subfamily serine protease
VATAEGANWKEKPTITVFFSLLGKSWDAHPAEVVGVDELSDLAVLRVDDTLSLFHDPLQWAKSIQAGEDVVAIGFARGQAGAPTVTRGIVSAVDRSLSEGDVSFAGLVQTDAAINHGNSGGPLLNMRGEVVGVNTYLFGTRFAWKKSPVMDKDGKEFKVKGEDGKEHTPFVRVPIPDVTQGMSYARDSKTARPFVDRLIASGRLRRASLGLEAATVVLPRETNGLWTRVWVSTEGVKITSIAKDSGAEAAGLKVGDIITGLSGVKPDDTDFGMGGLTRDFTIESQGDLNNALVFFAPPRKVKVGVDYIRPSFTPFGKKFDTFRCIVDVK